MFKSFGIILAVISIFGCSPSEKVGAISPAGREVPPNTEKQTEPAHQKRVESEPSTKGLHSLVIKGVELKVEIAKTYEERRRGLMFREYLPENQGMLFVYDEPGMRGFWMKNTYIPLSLAYIDENGKIFQLVDMEPLVEQTYPSERPAQFVLEVNKGWFEKNNIRVGDVVENLPR